MRVTMRIVARMSATVSDYHSRNESEKCIHKHNNSGQLWGHLVTGFLCLRRQTFAVKFQKFFHAQTPWAVTVASFQDIGDVRLRA